MKKIFFIVCIAAMSFVSCSKYDDVALWNKSMDMDSRISDLEALCQQLNGEIQSLQTIVEAVQNGDYVTSVVPVMQNGVEIGYTITFSKSAPVTIYHGKDGQNGEKGADGYTPVIGVRQDTDGIYYWTLDGDWLTDGSGNKIKAEGKDGADGKDGQNGTDGKDGADGKDGITPQLKIEDGYWFISYDNGLSWQNLGKATGEDGKNGTNGENGAAGKDGDSFFKSVDNSNSDYVILTLADGTEIKLPKYSQLDITFDIDDVLTIAANSTKDVAYTIISSIADVEIEVVTSSDIKAKVVKSSAAAGVITVTTGNTIDEYSHILVFVSNGEKTIMKRLDIEEGLEIPDDMELAFPDPIFRAYVLENFDKDKDGKISKEEALKVKNIYAGGTSSTPDNEKIATLEGVQYFTNLEDLNCYYNKLTSLDLSKNTSLKRLNCTDNLIEELDVSHNTALLTLICYKNQLKTLDLSKNINLGSLSCEMNQLTMIDVSHCTKLNRLECQDNQLTALDVSNNAELDYFWCRENELTSLDVSRNTALRYFVCSDNKLTELNLSNNTELSIVTCSNNQLTNLDMSKNTKLEDLSCGSNQITSLNVTNNILLTRLVCSSNQLELLDISYNTELKDLSCSNNNITELDVSYNTKLESLNCTRNNITELDVSKTNLGNSTSRNPLDCSFNPLDKLYLKQGWNIPYITQNRNISYIPAETEIIYVE